MGQKEKCIKRLRITLALILVLAALLGILYYILTSSARDQVVPLPPTEQAGPATSVFYPHSAEDEARLWKLVDAINRQNLPWTAAYNRLASLKPRNASRGDHKNDFAALLQGENISLAAGKSEDERMEAALAEGTAQELRRLVESSIVVPDSFDARLRWPKCARLHAIQHQAGCGSCWAAASASAMTDRLCVHANLTNQAALSLEDLVSCCEFCGGCTGAKSTLHPLMYLRKHGLVTGGSFGSSDGCRPYSLPPTCGAPCPPFYSSADNTPKCERKCQPLYGGSYESDVFKARSAYWLATGDDFRWTGTVKRVQQEILAASGRSERELIKRDLLQHGPTVISIALRESFFHYKRGVYTDPGLHAIDNAFYSHMMKVIGWGVEGGEEYWIVANSWGRQWGEDGFGRISTAYPYSMVAGRF